MLLPFLLPQTPLQLSEDSVGRREYAVELRLEDEKGNAMTESAIIAERITPKFRGFQRTRYVVSSVSDEKAPTYRPGAQETVLLDAWERGQGSRPQLVQLPDVTLPKSPLTLGSEWNSNLLGMQPVRCRYVGDEVVAGRPAVRVTIRSEDGKSATRFDEAYTLLDRTDALPLQTLLRVRVDFFGETSLLFRLRRTNVPGLRLPR